MVQATTFSLIPNPSRRYHGFAAVRRSQVVGDRYGWEDRDSGGKDAYL